MGAEWRTSDREGKVHILPENIKNRILRMDELHDHVHKLSREFEGMKNSIASVSETDQEKKGTCNQDLEFKNSELQIARSEFDKIKTGLKSEIEAVKFLQGWECNDFDDILSLYALRRDLGKKFIAFFPLHHLKEDEFIYLRDVALDLAVTINRFQRRSDPPATDQIQQVRERSPSPHRYALKFEDTWRRHKD